MKYVILIITFLLYCFPVGLVFANDTEEGCEIHDYACYQKKSKSCIDPSRGWMNENKTLGKVTLGEYPDFTTESIKEAIARAEQSDQKTPKEVSSQALSLAELNTFGGFRAAEVARKLYRKNMNSIFACGIIASRQDKLKRLKETIQGKGGASDIQKSIDKELNRYAELMGKMNCNMNMTDSGQDKVIYRISSSAMIEYCNYTYYLDYLEKSIENDFTNALAVDTSLNTTGGTGGTVRTLEAANSIFANYRNQIASERYRAQSTLPKALMAYKEMDRTYIVHILLVIIYDDYLKLRDNLDIYFGLVGQLFEKAFNAQDANGGQ